MDLPDAVGSATFEVREDVEYAEELRARVREGGLPDLRIVRLETEPKDPVDGHTIWIHADVINDGTGLAGSVKIGGYWKERKEENRITTYRPLRQSLWTIDSLYPGEEKEGTLRWDPVRDAGDSELIVVVDPNSWIRESDDDNNSATAEIHVRRKGDLVIRKDSVVFMKDENAGKLKMGAVLVNDGESDVEQEFRIRTDAYKGDDPSEKPTSVYTTFLAEDGLIPFKYGTGRAFVVVLPLDTVRVTITIDEDDIVDEETHDNDRLEVRVKDHLK